MIGYPHSSTCTSSARVRDSARIRHRGSDRRATRSGRSGVSFPHQLRLVLQRRHGHPTSRVVNASQGDPLTWSSMWRAKTVRAEATSRTTPSGGDRPPRPWMTEHRSFSRTKTPWDRVHRAAGLPGPRRARADRTRRDRTDANSHSPSTSRCAGSRRARRLLGTTTSMPAPTVAPRG